MLHSYNAALTETKADGGTADKWDISSFKIYLFISILFEKDRDNGISLFQDLL